MLDPAICRRGACQVRRGHQRRSAEFSRFEDPAALRERAELDASHRAVKALPRGTTWAQGPIDRGPPVAGESGDAVRLKDLMGSPPSYDRDGSDLMSRGLYLDMLAWGYHGSRHRPVTKRGANRRGARHTVCREDPREGRSRRPAIHGGTAETAALCPRLRRAPACRAGSWRRGTGTSGGRAARRAMT